MLVVLVLVLLPFGVGAQQPVPQLTYPVTDESSAVDVSAPGGDALDRLERDRNYQLFSLFIDSSEGESLQAYADRVVRANNLGAADALLVVAVEDRTYQLWLGDSIADEVSEDEQDDLLAREVEPALRAGRYSEAVSAAASAIRDASGVGGGTSTDGASEGGGGGGISLGVLLLPILFIFGLPVLVIWMLRRSARHAFGDREDEPEREREGRRRRQPEPAKMTLEQLEERANTLLLQVDEGLREAEQEAGFAEAEMAADEAQAFGAAIAAARADLTRAFELRQKLDDHIPDPPEVAREVLTEVIAIADTARQTLQAQFKALQERRDFERDAPATLDRLEAELARLESRIPAGEQAMAELHTQAPTAWQPVGGNLEEAQRRVEIARLAISTGRGLLETDRRDAARQARKAQQAIGEASVLLDALTNLAAQLVEARGQLASRLAEAEESMLLASDAATRGRGAPEKLESIRAKLVEARQRAAQDPPDLIGAYQLARHADATADEMVAAIRTAEEESQRTVQAARAEIAAASAEYERAADYIQGRRGSVGRAARTRLAESRRLLEEARALLSSDPKTALEEARRASSLADDALDLASDDFRERKTYGGDVFGGVGGMLPGMIILGEMLGRGMMSGRGGSLGRFGGGGLGRLGGGGRTFGGSFGGFGGRSRGGRW